MHNTEVPKFFPATKKKAQIKFSNLESLNFHGEGIFRGEGVFSSRGIFRGIIFAGGIFGGGGYFPEG